jgi:hypothetical protein
MEHFNFQFYLHKSEKHSHIYLLLLLQLKEFWVQSWATTRLYTFTFFTTRLCTYILATCDENP